MLKEVDKKIIKLIQGDLPVDPRPFALLAEKIGLTEDRLVKRIQELKKSGIIRRFGATLRHQEAGFNANAMVAWEVPEEKVDEVGQTLSRFKEVTHCYQRIPQKDWRHNLFAMIHGNDRNHCRRIAQQLSRSVGIKDYLLLFSEKEFKKTSMEYF